MYRVSDDLLNRVLEVKRQSDLLCFVSRDDVLRCARVVDVAVDVGKLVAVVLVEFVCLDVAIHHAVLLYWQERGLFHAEQAAVGALCNGGDGHGHLSLFLHAASKRWSAERLLVDHIATNFFCLFN